MASDMFGMARMTATRKTVPTRPEIATDQSTPRGAWRPASTVSSPNVRAVDSIDDEGHDDRHRGHRDNLCPEIEPAGEPAERPIRKPLRPLIDRSGDREMAGQLGEDQGHDELSNDHDRP